MFAGSAASAGSCNQSNELRSSLLSGRCPRSPRSRSPRGRLDSALRGAAVESALAPGMNVMKTFEPPLEALGGTRGDRRPPDREDARGRARRAVAADPPDVGRAPAGLRQAGLPARSRLAVAGPARRRARVEAARVRDPAAGLGEAAGGRSGCRERRDGGDAGAGGLAPSPARRVRGVDRPAAPSAPAAARPADDRRRSAAPGSTRSSGRPGSRPSARARSSTPTRSSACTTRSASSTRRSATTRR